MVRTAHFQSIFRIAYGLYAWIVLLAVTVPVAIGLLVTPGLSRRRRIAKSGASAVFRLIGSRVHLHGDSRLLEENPLVVANHSSYLDGIILTAALPPQYTFLIKHEMKAVPIAGFVLTRLGSEFVNRSDRSKRHQSARRLIDGALTGNAIAIFPEGTFDAKPGLKPFHPGALRIAYRADRTVIPVAITGARAKLPADAWLPRPGSLSVRLCEPVPAGSVASLDELTEAARRHMLNHLDEPDLDA